jgi:hypothetical protein
MQLVFNSLKISVFMCLCKCYVMNYDVLLWNFYCYMYELLLLYVVIIPLNFVHMQNISVYLMVSEW